MAQVLAKGASLYNINNYMLHMPTETGLLCVHPIQTVSNMNIAKSLNRVPASAGVKAGKSPLPGGR